MFPNLYAELARAGISTKDFAKAIHCHEASAKNKLEGRTEFKLSEVETIRRLFPECKPDYLFMRRPSRPTKRKAI